MNQKTIKLKILLLVLFLIGFQIGILSNIPKFTHLIIDDRKGDLNPFTSSTGWEPEIMESIGAISDAIDVCVGDANNDGYNDIISVNFMGVGEHDLTILLWNPILEDWDPFIPKSLGDNSFSVSTGDANNDGFNDIVAAWYSGTSPRISLFCWNSTSQDWDAPLIKSMTAEPGNIHVGDINNDGYNDVLIGGYGSNVFSCFFWNNSINDWDSEVTKSLSSFSEDVFFGDVNNDGLNDVAVTLNQIDNIEIFTWNDTLESWDTGILKSVGDNPFSIFIKDANNDGFNDIVTSNANSDDISIILWNNSISNWDGEIRKSVGNEPWCVFVNDANNDGFNDIIIGNTYDDDISLFTWNVTLNGWNSEIQLPISSGPYELFVDDVNNDGLNDIVSVYMLSYVSILLSYIDSPILNPIVPAVDIDGNVELNWSDIDGITHYYIFRDTSLISSIDGMSPIDTVIDSNYTDFLAMNDEYYYVVVAGDVNGNSSMSNCESVIVSVPLNAPLLSSISPDPDLDGNIDLDWDDIERATSYSIYRDTSFISSVGSLTPIDTSTDSNYVDIVTSNDIYHYAVIATDGSILSPISNCENVTVMMTLNEPVLSPISPNPDHDGIIYLEWDVNNRATIYYVYMDVSFISSVNSLTPIDTTGDNYYYDTILNNDTYYYVIVAGDGFVNSSISNCEEITTDLSLNTPILDLITPNLNYAGVVDLNWDDIEGATIYYIFRDKNPITSPNSLNPIYTTIESNFTDTIYSNGNYYYVIVAGNGVVNSTVSLNQNVSILIPLDVPNLVNVNEYGSNGIILEWNAVSNATLYYIFRDDTFITSIDHLVPIEVSSGLSYIDRPSQSGVYYYVVVASDGFANSSISNCGSLDFLYTPQAPAIPGYNVNLLFLTVLLCGILIGIRKSKKK